MITSKSNESIKHVKALSQKKYRDQWKEYVVEGSKMVKEAISENEKIQKILVSESYVDEVDFSDMEVVTDEIFAYLSDTQTPQGVLAILKQKEQLPLNGDIIFALDHIQDPGNLGTIIRTLDAAGITDLMLSQGTADIYNPKVVRSTMGGIFRMKTWVLEEKLNEALLRYQRMGYQIVVTDLKTNQLIYDIPFQNKTIVIIGNESNGVSHEVIEMADMKIKIPMPGKAESLNAAIASGIIAFEMVRQKYCSNK